MPFFDRDTSGEGEAPTDKRAVILFLHGFLDDASLWHPVIERLDAARYRCIAIDLPGMGARADDAGPFGLTQLTAAVLGIIDRVGAPVVIVGHSMGAQIAELSAVARPDAIIGMLLLTPVPLGGIVLPPDVADTMRDLGGNRAGQIALRTQFAVRLPEARLTELLDVGMKVKPPVAAALFDAWSSGDPAGRCETAFKSPVSIVGGEGDGFATPELMTAVIAPRFPEASVRYIPDAGHWPHVERPAATAAMLSAFLDIACRH